VVGQGRSGGLKQKGKTKKGEEGKHRAVLMANIPSISPKQNNRGQGELGGHVCRKRHRGPTYGVDVSLRPSLDQKNDKRS